MLNIGAWAYVDLGLVGFYGVSTIEGYLMPNPVVHIYEI